MALQNYLEWTNDPARIELLTSQWRDAVETHRIVCPCGRDRAIEHSYKCLYCGVWFCESCAEEHFGETRSDYRLRKSKEHVNGTP